MLGGGTVLAARWKHRSSSDLDLLLPDRQNLKDTGPGGRRDLARATGGQHKEIRPTQVKVTFPEGELDLAVIEPQLPGLETRTDVDGQDVIVLANAQILRGKCFRTDKAVTRDAFDIAVAREADPRSLEIAVNSLSARDARFVRHNLITTNDAMVKETKEGAVAGVAPEYRKHLDDVGIAAAEALDAHRYTRVRILATERGIRLETRTDGRPTLRREDYEGRDGTRALLESGIEAYLKANSEIEPRELGWTLNDVMKNGWKGTVFDSNDGDPGKRLERVRRSAGIPEPPELRLGGDPNVRPAATRPPQTEVPTRPTERNRGTTVDPIER